MTLNLPGCYLAQASPRGFLYWVARFKLVKSERDFYDKSEDYATSLSHSKVAKIEAILKYFNKDSQVLSAASILLDKSVQKFRAQSPT